MGILRWEVNFPYLQNDSSYRASYLRNISAQYSRYFGSGWAFWALLMYRS